MRGRGGVSSRENLTNLTFHIFFDVCYYMLVGAIGRDFDVSFFDGPSSADTTVFKSKRFSMISGRISFQNFLYCETALFAGSISRIIWNGYAACVLLTSNINGIFNRLPWKRTLIGISVESQAGGRVSIYRVRESDGELIGRAIDAIPIINSPFNAGGIEDFPHKRLGRTCMVGIDIHARNRRQSRISTYELVSFWGCICNLKIICAI